jgi:hypothetical protein
VFGDIVNGRVFHAYASTLEGAGVPTTLLNVGGGGQPGLARTDLRFASDLAGNLYITAKQDGWCGASCRRRLGQFPPYPGGDRPHASDRRNWLPRLAPEVIG